MESVKQKMDMFQNDLLYCVISIQCRMETP
jgi:hypothetical protein